MFQKPQMGRRIIVMLIAHLILALGIALLKYSALGNDPFSAMMMALTAKTPLSYGTFCLLGNCVFFAIELIWGRRYIGVGTIVNWFLLGYIVSIWYDMLCGLALPTASLYLRVPVALAAVVIIGFGLSLYQSSDVGLAPYDCVPLILKERFHLPFFVTRVITDGGATLICLFANGLLGLGTILVFVGLGPVAAFFNQHFSEKLFQKPAENPPAVE